jgi:IclR family KDG regulon transcriptional repressor
MKGPKYSAPSVKKAFKILRAIADSPMGLGVSELAKELDLGKSTVHGIVSALEEMGVLIREGSQKKYRVGYTLLELGSKASARLELREVARIPMERLMQGVGETVFLGSLNGDHVTILDVVESGGELKITSPPGTRLPLLAGTMGRVFGAQLEEKKVRELVRKMGLMRYTSKSVTDPGKFLSDVREAREKGYVVDDEEYILGVRAVAAPIPTRSYPPAAIWVVGFASSLTDAKMERVIREIRQTAEEISYSLDAPLRGKS